MDAIVFSIMSDSQRKFWMNVKPIAHLSYPAHITRQWFILLYSPLFLISKAYLACKLLYKVYFYLLKLSVEYGGHFASFF